MKKNVFSLLFLIALFLLALYCGKLYFSIAMCLFAVLSLREMINIRIKDRRYPIEIEILSYVAIIFFIMNNYDGNYEYYFLDYRLIASLILIDLMPLVVLNSRSKYSFSSALYLMGATLFIGSTFNLIVQFRSYDVDYVIYIFLIALFTDLFGFIAGRLIGKHKLTNISPKKTVEGAICGSFVGTFVPTLFFLSTIGEGEPVFVVIIITLFLSILGQVGDLVFSYIKREYNRKEFSNMILGNGGILDIIDSLIFITLGFLLILAIL